MTVRMFCKLHDGYIDDTVSLMNTFITKLMLNFFFLIRIHNQDVHPRGLKLYDFFE
jgi:hypothetical protein